MSRPDCMAYAAVVMRGCSPAAWLIRATHERDDDGAPLYWSNAQGWVDMAGADRFDEGERMTLCLPTGGTWEGVSR